MTSKQYSVNSKNAHSWEEIDQVFGRLNSISVADFCSESKPRRLTVDSGRFFEVERIISSREGQQVSLVFSVGELTRNVGKKVSISL